MQLLIPFIYLINYVAFPDYLNSLEVISIYLCVFTIGKDLLKLPFQSQYRQRMRGIAALV